MAFARAVEAAVPISLLRSSRYLRLLGDPGDRLEHIASKTGDRAVPVATPSRRRVNLSVEKLRETFYQPAYDYKRMIDDALGFRAGEDIGVIPA